MKTLLKLTTAVGVLFLLLGVMSVHAASLSVTTTADAGSGSLRQAIIDATTNAAANIVTINIPTSDPGYDAVANRFTINLLTPLPSVPLAPMSISNNQAQAVSVRGNGTFRVFTLVDSAVLTINNLTITNGFANNGLGGGIFMGASSTLNLNGSTVSGNIASDSGGGIYMKNSGTLHMSRSTVRDNIAINGGGIFIFDSGTLNMDSSTVAANFAITGGNGGGIYNGTSGTINGTSNTIDGNIAAGFGGGIYNTATITMTNNTISSNVANRGGGIYNGFTATLQNNLVALNAATAGGDLFGGGGLGGNAYAGTYNLIGNADDSSGLGSAPNRFGTTANPLNPMLGPLQNNGGPTFTREPLTGSPAIDKGNSATLILDQRGLPRLFDHPLIPNDGGNSSDIGAFEVQTVAVEPTPTPTPTPTVTPTPTPTPEDPTPTPTPTPEDPTPTPTVTPTPTITPTPTPTPEDPTPTVTPTPTPEDPTPTPTPEPSPTPTVEATPTPTPTPQPKTIFITDVSLGEGPAGVTQFIFDVEISFEPPPPGETISVDFATVDDTATAASGDFQPASGTVTFTSGSPTLQHIVVNVNGDMLAEPNETFTVQLSNIAGIAVFNKSTGLGTIFNEQVIGTPTPTQTPEQIRLEGDVVDEIGTDAGDNNVLSNDVSYIRAVLLGNLPAIPSGSQFQAADANLDMNDGCGNGQIDAGDVVVIRRYNLGDIPLNAVCGPMGPTATTSSAITSEHRFARSLSIGSVTATAGSLVEMPVDFEALGDEAAAGFTLTWNTKALRLVDVAAGAGVPSGAVLGTNRSQIVQGSLGVLIDSATPFEAGTRRVMVLTFAVGNDAEAGTYDIAFGDSLVNKGIATLTGGLVESGYNAGSVLIGTTRLTGRVVNGSGGGLRNAVVTITDQSGTRRTTTTGSLGYYRFDNVLPTSTLVVEVASKRYRFAPRVVQMLDALTDASFTSVE